MNGADARFIRASAPSRRYQPTLLPWTVTVRRPVLFDSFDSGIAFAGSAVTAIE
jgi:hypothetical protein